MPKQKTQFGDSFITLCDCGDPDHSMVVSAWIEEEPDFAELIFEFGTENINLRYRLKKMIQYIFGRNKRYCFRSMLMQKEEAKNLVEFIQTEFLDRAESK